ncbi:MAG: hypothetical protein KJ043_05580 [Anaerolineae bacterium]|nr:hypothetical protein [Anaerolineae bacterium]
MHKRLNIIHLILLLGLPILLALINPNWLFNLSFSHEFIIMVDDYIYTGYQMAFSQYIGWFPSDTLYFIERLSVILPVYVLNQVTTPLIAHVVVHIMLYYVAIFAVYGILNKLAHARVALIIALLFGQYPIVMRSLGWNYPDGFAMTYFLLALLWLMYATESRWRPVYLIGAGGAVMVMIIAHFFNLFYIPAVALYFIFLDKLYQKPIRLLTSGIFVTIGAGIVYAGLALIYHSFTGKILLSNALDTTQGFAQGLPYFLSYHFSGVSAYWHVFLGMVALIAGVFIVKNARTFSSDVRRMMIATLILFVSAYAVLAGLHLLGFSYFQVSFYHANIIMTAFLLMGMVIYKPASDLSPAQFRLIVLSVLIIPLGVFAGLTYLSPNWDVIYPVALIGIAVFGTFTIISRHPLRMMVGVILFAVCASALVGDSVLVKIYTPDRYHEQTVFEDATAIAQTVNTRYPRLSMDDFRLWYDFSDPKLPTFHAVSSIYLWTQGRNARLNETPPENTFFEANQIVILSSLHDKDTLLQMASNTIENRGIITFIDELVINDIRLVILNVRLAMVTNDWLTYYFSDTQQQYVLYESGWNGYEQVPQNSRPFRWTAEPTARLTLDVSGGWFDATATYRLSFVIAGYLEDEVVNSLTLTVNGAPIGLIRADNRYVGYVAGEYLINPQLELVFQTDRVSNPFDLGIQDGRKLGVAIGELIIDRVIESD